MAAVPPSAGCVVVPSDPIARSRRPPTSILWAMTRTQLTLAELRESVGRELGTSDWRLVDQEAVDRFAEVTGDDQWLHVDVERAASGPFGQTIVHGYLLFSLLPVLLRDVLEITDCTFTVNYGINRVRFTAPVAAGSRVRLRAAIAGVEERGGQVQYLLDVTLEVEGGSKPAFVGEVVYLAS